MTKAILTDIEGTTSSIAFVKDVLFPYATTQMPQWLQDNCRDEKVAQQIEQVAKTIGCPASDLQAVTEQLLDWIERDIKSPPLKALQGMLWENGYADGDYTAHVYEDAVQKLQDWYAAGIPLYVYSSGSIQAQKLFFQYSRYGDIRRLFAGHFDTTSGAKTEAASYTGIANSMQLEANDVLFLSDVEAEIDAATLAGMSTVLITRPEDFDRPLNDRDYRVARNFHEVPVSFSLDTKTKE